MTSVFFLGLVLINFILFFFLRNIGQRPCFSWTRNTILSPVAFLILLLLFFLADFIALYFSDMNFQLYEENLPIDQVDVLIGYLFFTVCSVGLVVGVDIATRRPFLVLEKNSPGIVFSVDKKISGIIFYVIFSSLIAISITQGGLLSSQVSGDFTRQVIFSENKLLFVLFGLLIPAYAVHMASLEKGSYFLIPTFLALLVCLATGSRGWVIYIFLITAFAKRDFFEKVSVQMYLLAVPIGVFFLLISRFYFRESWRYSGFGDFLDDKGGVFGVFFNTSEVSMAEVISTLIKYSDVLNRQVFDGLLSALMYPLPRDLFDFKPLGGDAYVTSVFSPDRWFWTKSEITITVFGDLYLHFGFVFSFVFILVIFYFITRFICFGILFPRVSAIFVPAGMWFMYVMLRSSIFNVASPIWSWIGVVSINYLIFLFFLKTRKNFADS